MSLKLRTCVAAYAVGLLSLCGMAPAHAFTASEFYEHTAPSVWKIVTYDTDGLALAAGSAVVIGPEKLITNCHVLRKAKRFIIRQGNTAHGATLESLDVERDLCLIKVKDLNAPAVAVARVGDVKVGDPVYTLGNPKGLELTLGSGLISALRKDESDHVVWIQTSAPTSAGSSGGGLFTADGRLLGITSMIVPGYDAQNISFARPAEWISEVPARSAAALKARQEREAEAASKIQDSPAKNSPGRLIKGEKLVSMFRNLGIISATSSLGTPLRINVSPSGQLYVQSMMTGIPTNGIYEFHEGENQVCFTMYNWNFQVMNGCYNLYQTAAHEYLMKPTSGGYYITYKTE